MLQTDFMLCNSCHTNCYLQSQGEMLTLWALIISSENNLSPLSIMHGHPVAVSSASGTALWSDWGTSCYSHSAMPMLNFLFAVVFTSMGNI